MHDLGVEWDQENLVNYDEKGNKNGLIIFDYVCMFACVGSPLFVVCSFGSAGICPPFFQSLCVCLITLLPHAWLPTGSIHIHNFSHTSYFAHTKLFPPLALLAPALLLFPSSFYRFLVFSHSPPFAMSLSHHNAQLNLSLLYFHTHFYSAYVLYY